MRPESHDARCKLGRAGFHLETLRAEMNAWLSRADMGSRAEISDDRLTVTYRVSLREDPPLGAWTLILGDSLHNTRSALDTLVWAYCDSSALTASQQRAIQWPVVADPERWDGEAARKLRNVPPHLVDAIKACQPFNVQQGALPNGLKLLHDLDIVDKHRLSISAKVQAMEIGHNATIEFETGDDGPRFEQDQHEYHGDVTLRDGSAIAIHRFLSRVAKVSGRFDISFQLQVDHDGLTFPPTDLLQSLIATVWRTVEAIDQVATSSEQEDDPRRSRS